jgi:hypothetical protein
VTFSQFKKWVNIIALFSMDVEIRTIIHTDLPAIRERADNILILYKDTPAFESEFAKLYVRLKAYCNILVQATEEEQTDIYLLQELDNELSSVYDKIHTMKKLST